MKLSLKLSLLGSVAWAGFAVAQAVQAQDVELIVGSFGSAYDEVLVEASRSFEEEYGVRVTILPGGASVNIPRARNGEIDVLLIGKTDLMRLEAEGLFAPLDPEWVPNLEHLYPQAIISENAVVANFGAYALAYNTDNIETPPSSWADLANPEYAGRVSLRPFTVESVDLIVMLAKLEGGDERNPDAGFAKMAEIAQNVHVWEGTHPGILNLFRNDEIDLAVWSDGRIAWGRDEENVAVDGFIPVEGFSPLASSMAVLATTEHLELSQRYLNHLLDDEAGIGLAERLNYFPSNQAIVLPEGTDTGFVTAETVDGAVDHDWAYLVTVYDEWHDRWNREIQR